MANVKFSDLTANPSIASTDLIAVSKNGGGSRKETMANVKAYANGIWFESSGNIFTLVNGDNLDMRNGDITATNITVDGEYQISTDRVLAIDATDRSQLFVGYHAGINTQINGIAYRNTAVGHGALETNVEGGYNTAIGFSSLQSNAQTGNAGQNTAVGAYSIWQSTGVGNSVIGHSAGYHQSAGDNNVLIGAYAGNGGTGPTTYAKSNNVMIGTASGQNTLIGNGNVFIGYQSGFSETGSNKLYIENSNSVTPLIYGEFDTNLVKINGNLEVTGAAKIPAHPVTIRNTNFALGTVDLGAVISLSKATSGTISIDNTLPDGLTTEFVNIGGGDWSFVPTGTATLDSNEPITPITTGEHVLLKKLNATDFYAIRSPSRVIHSSSGNYVGTTLTNNRIIEMTDTSAPRTVQISTADVASTTTDKLRYFTVIDEGGLAGTNNITVSLQTGLINGGANFLIAVNNGSITFYSDSTNCHII